MRTTTERWIDAIAFLVTMIVVIFSKPESGWEGAAPFIWIVAVIVAVHWIMAAREVWKQASLRHEIEPPILLPDGARRITVVADGAPRWSHIKVLLAAFVGLLLLCLLSYQVRVLEVNSVRTYVYLVPSVELVECQRRAFSVRVSGPQHISGLQIVLKDNTSGQVYSQKYSDVDADTASEYFWVIPSSPWTEDYTAIITAHGLHSSQRLIVQSSKGKAQLAAQVTIAGDKKPALSCRDALSNTGNLMLRESPCAEVLKLQGDLMSKIDVSNYQRADGAVTIRHVKELPSPLELDERSDDRHLTEYQRQILEPTLTNYPNTRLIVLFAGGLKSKAYAGEFRDVFHKHHWRASGPELVPIGDERIIDVVLSVRDDNQEVSLQASKIRDLLSAFDKAGIKHTHHFARDPNVPNGALVLWVGPRSPTNISPDQCAVPELRPKPWERHTCELIRQTEGVCPFVPK